MARYSPRMAESVGVDEILRQWQQERPDLDTSPIGVIGRISRLAREIEDRLEPVYAACGLEPGWYDVLATLRRSGPPFQMRPTDFAAALMLTTSGTTKRLDRLEAAGHITRQPDPGDRRGVLITLTASGRELIDNATTQHMANEHGILSGLSADDRKKLACLAPQVEHHAPAARLRPPTAGFSGISA